MHNNTTTFARFPCRLWWWTFFCFHLCPDDTTCTIVCAVSEQQKTAKTIPSFYPNQLKLFPVFVHTSWNNSQFLSKPVETIPGFYQNQLKQFPVCIQTSWNYSQFLSIQFQTIPSFYPNQLKQFPVFIPTSWNNSQFSSILIPTTQPVTTPNMQTDLFFLNNTRKYWNNNNKNVFCHELVLLYMSLNGLSPNCRLLVT